MPDCIDCGREAVQVIYADEPIYLCDRCPATRWLRFFRECRGYEPDGPHSLPREGEAAR